ncbi:hypothetical protein PM082_023229 [Marasmius tenuissimus]|nr:hypothetical protein PM082_023229 [Marasmius tenuissimus]
MAESGSPSYTSQRSQMSSDEEDEDEWPSAPYQTTTSHTQNTPAQVHSSFFPHPHFGFYPQQHPLTPFSPIPVAYGGPTPITPQYIPHQTPQSLSPNEKLHHQGQELEKQFSNGLFRGLYYKADRNRSSFVWTKPSFRKDTPILGVELESDEPRDGELTDEERLLIVFNCMRKVGFSTLGELLWAMFGINHTSEEYISVSRTIQSFLHCDAKNSNEHPVSIVNAIYNHKKSENWTNRRRNPVHFTIPQYAQPPSQRLIKLAPSSIVNSTRGDLLNWSVQRTMAVVDCEAGELSSLRELTRFPGEKITWTSILSWDMLNIQELVALRAPVIFSIFCTVAVNHDIRARVIQAASGDSGNPSDPLHHDTHPIDSRSPNDVNGNSTASENEADTIPEPPCPEPPDQEPEALTPEDLHPDSKIYVSGIPPKVHRDPWLAVTIALMMVLYMRYRCANFFATVIGIFLFTCNANRDLIAMLSRCGLSLSYSAILATLHTLASDADAKLLLYGKAVSTAQPLFQFLFDNVNKMHRAWEQVWGRRDEVMSGTASSLIELVDVPLGALRLQPLLERIERKGRLNMTVDTLKDDINWGHLAGVGSATVLRILVSQIEPMGQFKADVEKLFSATYARHRRPPKKSTIRTMRPTDIDESSTKGVLQVVHNLVKQAGIALTALPQWILFFCGDQLSIDRLRHLKIYMEKTEGAEKHAWVLPIIQLWHMKWAWQKAIFKLHWQPMDAPGLRHDTQDILRRDKFNADKCDFYPAHHILEDRFVALVLEAIRLICQEKSGITIPEYVPLIECLGRYFGEGGYFEQCSFEDLKEIGELVFDRYMHSGAYNDALSGNRPTDTYGPTSDEPGIAHSTNPASDTMGTTTSTSRSKSSGKKPKAKQGMTNKIRNVSMGDQTLANEIHFMRVTFWYLEMCAAISEGDIGRVMEIIKVLRISFWGTGSTNYANELLEQACNFLYDFPEDLKTAILNNYLVNTSGLPGRFFELDLLQEHFNFWLKRLFNAKSHEFDSKHLSEVVGLNIRGFGQLREQIVRVFGLKPNSAKHTSPDRRVDINALGKHLRSTRVLTYIAQREHAYRVNDEFGRGLDHLEEQGGLAAFIRRTAGITPDFSASIVPASEGAQEPANSSGGAEPVDGIESPVRGEAIPANPLEIADGVLESTQFQPDM